MAYGVLMTLFSFKGVKPFIEGLLGNTNRITYTNRMEVTFVDQLV